METLTITRFNIPVAGVQKKTICHFSDIHLTAYDELSTAEEKEQALKDTQGWIDTRLYFAKAHGAPTGEAQMADSRVQYARLVSLANTVDAAVLTGDIMNHVTPADIRATEKGLADLQVPYVIVCGNHEPKNKLPDGMRLSIMKEPVSVVDLGDLQILGIDNQERRISREQLDKVAALLATGKKTVVAMHVPILNKENYDAVYGCGDYFRMNEYEGCPEENEEFIRLLTGEESPVVAVLTGHLHFQNVSHLNEEICQYGVSQGITGNVHLYTIGE